MTSPVNMYIKPSPWWRFPLKPKYHPILFKKTGIYTLFTFDVLLFISVHSMKRSDEFFFYRLYSFLYIT